MKIENQISTNNSYRPKVNTYSYVMMVLSGLLGGVSMILFGIFLYAGLPSQMDLGFNEQMNFFINSLLCSLFFLQHSLMIRKWFRKWLSGFISPNYIGAIFSIFSGFFLLILMVFWQKSTSFQVELNGLVYFFMRALFFLSIIGFYVSIRSIMPFDAFGIREIISYLKGKTPKGSSFKVQGTYQWVRHPLYFFSFLVIWTQVSLTPDRFLFNGLWTVWIIVGAFLEERDLVESFGDAYRNYQRNVPMLIPYRFRPWNRNKH